MCLPTSRHDDELLLLHAALEKLEAESPDKAKLVKLRYFAGLVASRGRRGPQNLSLNRRSVLGLRPSIPFFRHGRVSKETEKTPRTQRQTSVESRH